MLIFKIEKNRYKNQIDLYICFFLIAKLLLTSNQKDEIY